MMTRRFILFAAAAALRAEEQPLRLSSLDRVRILRRVEPDYPELAWKRRIGGRVRLTVLVGEDGSVEKVQVVSGHPLLAPAAVKALMQWRFEPVALNGRPRRFSAPVEIRFHWLDESRRSRAGRT
ncbi:MAG TPA: energy transducer TonB [Bryobacteraceae bacterium]|nr:energy transducer TonB [Bryobacteraceae bacterium]